MKPTNQRRDRMFAKYRDVVNVFSYPELIFRLINYVSFNKSGSSVPKIKKQKVLEHFLKTFLINKCYMIHDF